MSNYIETYSGLHLHLPDVHGDQISIVDIAHALSNAPRFAGHLTKFYSVAEHSIQVAKEVMRQTNHSGIALQGLLHDATEAYLADIPTPFKLLLPEYMNLEHILWTAIANKFGVAVEMASEVKLADRMMLMSERDAMKKFTSDWGEKYESTPRIADMSVFEGPTRDPGAVEKEFLDLFYHLYSRI